MTGLTSDTHLYRYGVGDRDQLVAYPLGASQTVYYGGVALKSGSGSVTTGYLKNAASPGTADLVVGMIDDPAGGTYVKTAPGITGTATDGGVWVNVTSGTFFFQNSSIEAVAEANVGQTVYYQGENTSGPIVSATSQGSTLPVLGILLPQDPGITGGFAPGSSYWPVKLTVVGGP